MSLLFNIIVVYYVLFITFICIDFNVSCFLLFISSIHLFTFLGPSEEEKARALRVNENYNYNNYSDKEREYDNSTIHINDDNSEKNMLSNKSKDLSHNRNDNNYEKNGKYDNSIKSVITTSRSLFQKASVLARNGVQNVPKPSTGVSAYFQSTGEREKRDDIIQFFCHSILIPISI